MRLQLIAADNMHPVPSQADMKALAFLIAVCGHSRSGLCDVGSQISAQYT